MAKVPHHQQRRLLGLSLTAGGLLPASLLTASATFLLQGCSFITIAYCEKKAIPHGVIRGTWQHDAAVVDCDEGYEYGDEDIVCDVYDHQCNYHKGKEECKSIVGLTVRSKARQNLGGARRLTEEIPGAPAPNIAHVGCSRTTDRSTSSGVEAWVQHFFTNWNSHDPNNLVSAFAPAAGGVNGSLGADLADALPRSHFQVKGVHACSGSRAALVELLVASNESNRTVNVTDLMEFDHRGLITAKTREAITRIVQNVENGHRQGSLKVSGLPPNGNDLYLYKMFAPFGAIQSVKADLAEDGTCTGVGVVVFANAVDAQAARLKMDGHAPDQNVVDGHPDKNVVLHVSVKTPGAEEEKTE